MNLRNAVIQRAPAKPTHDFDRNAPANAPRNRQIAPADLRFRSILSLKGAVRSLASLRRSHNRLVMTTVGKELNFKTRLATIAPAV